MKHRFYFAFLAYFAIFAFLASCGEGDAIDLADLGSDRENYEEAWSNLRDAIGKCEGGTDVRCPSENSSSGGVSPSSSSVGPQIGPGELSCTMPVSEVRVGSSIVPLVTCDGQTVGSVAYVPLTDITVSGSQITFNAIRTYTISATANCGGIFQQVPCTPNVRAVALGDNDYQVPNFTCSWNPSTGLIAGDLSKVSVTIDNPNGTQESDCADRKVFIVIDPNAAYPDTAFINPGVDMATSGTLQGKYGGSWTWPTSGSVTFRSTLTCSNSSSFGSNSKNCAPLTLSSPPKATISGAKTAAFTEQDYSSSSTLYYYINSKPAFSHNVTAITNNTAAKCDKARYEIRGPSSYYEYQDYSVSSSNLASIPGSGAFSASSALPSVTSNQEITGRLIVTCRGIPDTLATAKATLVPNPSLSGECKWNVENNTFLGGTAPVLGTPVPTVQNNYGRCSSTPVISENGTSVYGNLPNVAQGTQQTVTLRLYPACPSGTPYGAGIACPAITVKNAADACDYNPATHCNGVAKNQIITAAQNCPGTGTCGNNSKGKCFYATDITKMAAANGATGNDRVTINGSILSTTNGNCANDGQWSLPTCTSALSSVSKVDGGYYIYVHSNAWTDNGFTTQNTYNDLHPNCR